MSRPYDASLKELIERYPADWLALAGLTAQASPEVIDADISTVTAAADKVLRVGDATPWLMHFELQSSPKSELAEYLHWCNALLRHRHRLLVRTVLVLLRPAADSPGLTGVYQEQFPTEPAYQVFRYRVVRLWQCSAETLLTGGLGTLPLAPISDATEAELPAVVRQIDERLEKEATREQAVVLGAATFLLSGLRLPASEFLRLYQGVPFMSIIKDSSAYRFILEEGEKQGEMKQLHETLLQLGKKRFGPPEEATLAALAAITDLERLKGLRERLLDVGSWQELLATQ